MRHALHNPGMDSMLPKTFSAAFFKGTRPGIPGLYNRLGRFMDHGPYSHCELVFSNGMSGSSSFMDGGVRLKYIGYTSGDWDFVELPKHKETEALRWFIEHRGAKYDIRGNINAAFGWVVDSSDKWFCSESMAASLGLVNPWRHKPNGLFDIMKAIT